MTSHFARLGMKTIGDIARTPLPRLKEKFRARFGKQSDIHAEVMWRTANGLDDRPLHPARLIQPQISRPYDDIAERLYRDVLKWTPFCWSLLRKFAATAAAKALWVMSSRLAACAALMKRQRGSHGK